MIIQAVNMDRYWWGQSKVLIGKVATQYAAKQGDKIGVGKTVSEAINNCIAFDVTKYGIIGKFEITNELPNQNSKN